MGNRSAHPSEEDRHGSDTPGHGPLWKEGKELERRKGLQQGPQREEIHPRVTQRMERVTASQDVAASHLAYALPFHGSRVIMHDVERSQLGASEYSRSVDGAVCPICAAGRIRDMV